LQSLCPNAPAATQITLANPCSEHFRANLKLWLM
jgi:hypothetical protein